MILNKRKIVSTNSKQAFCFHGAVLVLAIICFILILVISNNINGATSFAIDQFVKLQATFVAILQVFKTLHLVACCLTLILGYTRFHHHWHSGVLFCTCNLILYLPSEAFVFKYIDAFNFNSTHWVILRYIQKFVCSSFKNYE